MAFFATVFRDKLALAYSWNLERGWIGDSLWGWGCGGWGLPEAARELGDDIIIDLSMPHFCRNLLSSAHMSCPFYVHRLYKFCTNCHEDFSICLCLLVCTCLQYLSACLPIHQSIHPSILLKISIGWQFRQFSSMLVLVGRVTSATSFDPTYAAIIQNKDTPSLFSPFALLQADARDFRHNFSVHITRST